MKTYIKMATVILALTAITIIVTPLENEEMAKAYMAGLMLVTACACPWMCS